MTQAIGTFKLAAVASSFFTDSHADIFLSRWYTHRDSDCVWGWNGPRSALASLYVEQPDYSRPSTPDRAKRALTREVSERFAIPKFESVAEALTLGGSELAVDGVLLIGEHGDYPENELGQRLYPRKELFDQIVRVFRETGKAVPVFCDKFYSWNFDWAREMAATANEMGFMLLAGSSVPLCPLEPALSFSTGDHVLEALGTCYGHREAYGFHSIELLQSLLERRAGGESGVRRIEAVVGPQVWHYLESRATTWRLLRAALSAATGSSDTSRLKTEVTRPECVIIEHNDGVRVTHVCTEGFCDAFTAALQTRESPKVMGTVAKMGTFADGFGHMAALAAQVEEAMLTGRHPFNPKRHLLSNGIVCGMMRALAEPGRPIEFADVADGIASYGLAE